MALVQEIEMLQSVFHKKKDWIITLTITIFRMRKETTLSSFPTSIIVSKLTLYLQFKPFSVLLRVTVYYNASHSTAISAHQRSVLSNKNCLESLPRLNSAYHSSKLLSLFSWPLSHTMSQVTNINKCTFDIRRYVFYTYKDKYNRRGLYDKSIFHKSEWCQRK